MNIPTKSKTQMKAIKVFEILPKRKYADTFRHVYLHDQY